MRGIAAENADQSFVGTISGGVDIGEQNAFATKLIEVRGDARQSSKRFDDVGSKAFKNDEDDVGIRLSQYFCRGAGGLINRSKILFCLLAVKEVFRVVG